MEKIREHQERTREILGENIENRDWIAVDMVINYNSTMSL
jgi:hypothetical protein